MTYLRRLLPLCIASAIVTALVVGLLFLWAVIVDAYPVVPSEGFGVQRKAFAVVEGAALGAVLGLPIGIAVFALWLAWDAVKTRLAHVSRRHVDRAEAETEDT